MKKPNRRAGRRPGAPTREASIQISDKQFDSPTKKPSLKELTSSWGDLSLMLELDSPTANETASRELATKEEMLALFGFKQSHCDFCWKEVDISQAQLQKCMCNKKHFCKGCSKSDKVQKHQQECAMERFNKRQQQSDISKSNSDHTPRTAKATSHKKTDLSNSEHVSSTRKKKTSINKSSKSKSIKEPEISSPTRGLLSKNDGFGQSIRALVSPRRTSTKKEKKGDKTKTNRQTSISGLHEALSFQPSPSNKTKRRASLSGS